MNRQNVGVNWDYVYGPFYYRCNGERFHYYWESGWMPGEEFVGFVYFRELSCIFVETHICFSTVHIHFVSSEFRAWDMIEWFFYVQSMVINLNYFWN